MNRKPLPAPHGSIVGLDGRAMVSAPPVTDYVYCPACGIELPRPSPQLVGAVLPCPCCSTEREPVFIRVARTEHIWCSRTSALEII